MIVVFKFYFAIKKRQKLHLFCSKTTSFRSFLYYLTIVFIVKRNSAETGKTGIVSKPIRQIGLLVSIKGALVNDNFQADLTDQLTGLIWCEKTKLIIDDSFL